MLFDGKGLLGLYAIWGKGAVAGTLRRIFQMLFWPYVWWFLIVMAWAYYGWIAGIATAALYILVPPILVNVLDHAQYGENAAWLCGERHSRQEIADAAKPLPVKLDS